MLNWSIICLNINANWLQILNLSQLDVNRESLWHFPGRSIQPVDPGLLLWGRAHRASWHVDVPANLSRVGDYRIWSMDFRWFSHPFCGGFLTWGVPQIAGSLFHGKSYQNGWFGGSRIFRTPSNIRPNYWDGWNSWNTLKYDNHIWWN